MTLSVPPRLTSSIAVGDPLLLGIVGVLFPAAAARFGISRKNNMPPQISIHDNHLAAYSVLAKEKKIVFHTEFRDREPYEFTDVVFEEVLAYHFENDLFGTIIFDIEEVDLSALLKEHAAMFEVGWRYGWPRGWEKEKEEIEVFARRLGMRAFELSSSCGMSGWVIAKCMSKIRKDPQCYPALHTL